MTMNRDQLYGMLLRLLRVASPHPDEKYYLESILPQGGKWDKENNYVIEVPGDSETLFAAHLDTVGDKPKLTEPIYKDGFLYASGKDVRCLGGDDRCGILCLMALIEEGIPGTYIFHGCEERGAHGAQFLVTEMDMTKFKRAIEFDRRGTQSIISEMSGDKVCSPEFSTALAGHIGMQYAADPTGSFTDVYFYRDVVPEVTNVSVGYYKEHSKDECIAVLWLIDHLVPALLKVPWETLPVVHNPVAEKEEEERAWRERQEHFRSFDRHAFGSGLGGGLGSWGKYEKHSSGMYVPRGMTLSDELDEEFNRKMKEEEEIDEAWQKMYGVDIDDKETSKGNDRHHDSNFGDQFGVCDCCDEEDFVESVDTGGKYMFCETCAEQFFAAFDDVESAIDSDEYVESLTQ